MASDLESLRTRILAGRAHPVPLDPATMERSRRHAAARDRGWPLSDLVVTRTGEIRTVQETGKQAAGISRVTTEVFAGKVDEEAWAARHLPPGYSRFVDGDAPGWVYTVRTNHGDEFTLFLYWDRFQRVYRVRLIAPRLEQLGLVHATHLYSDGHLCISRGAGERLFNNAYAKSAMWADGISHMIDGHAWPWGE